MVMIIPSKTFFKFFIAPCIKSYFSTETEIKNLDLFEAKDKMYFKERGSIWGIEDDHKPFEARGENIEEITHHYQLMKFFSGLFVQHCCSILLFP